MDRHGAPVVFSGQTGHLPSLVDIWWVSIVFSGQMQGRSNYVVFNGQMQGLNYVVFSGQMQGLNYVVFSGQTDGVYRA